MKLSNKSKKGQGSVAVEYIALVGCLCIPVLAGTQLFGTKVNTWFEELGSKLGSPTQGGEDDGSSNFELSSLWYGTEGMGGSLQSGSNNLNDLINTLSPLKDAADSGTLNAEMINNLWEPITLGIQGVWGSIYSTSTLIPTAQNEVNGLNFTAYENALTQASSALDSLKSTLVPIYNNMFRDATEIVNPTVFNSVYNTLTQIAPILEQSATILNQATAGNLTVKVGQVMPAISLLATISTVLNQ